MQQKVQKRRVKDLITAIVPDTLTEEQIVTTLAAVAVHPDTRRYFKSADLIDPEDLAAFRHNEKQTAKLLTTILKTDKRQGRQTNDDRRALARALFLAFSDSPTKDGDSKKIPSIRSRIKGFGLPLTTAYRYWNSVKNDRKLVSEGKLDQVNYSSFFTQDGKYQKISDYIRKDSFYFNERTIAHLRDTRAS